MALYAAVLLSSGSCTLGIDYSDRWLEYVRKDHLIEAPEGHQLHIREIEPRKRLYPEPLLLIHGGGPGSTASFDIHRQEASFADALVDQGFAVYLLNIRGWERSTLPEYNLMDTTLVLGSVEEASRDIHTAVEWILGREPAEKINLFGWATGGHWIGHYAIHHTERVHTFIALNMLYGVNAPWPLRNYLAHPQDSTRFHKTGFWRITEKSALTRSWTRSIPIPNKEAWRDPAVVEAYREQAVQFGRDTSVLKVPGGYREESFYLSLGRKYWDAADLQVPTLIIRSELDFWSRRADLDALQKALHHHPSARCLSIPGTHYVFLDRPARGRETLIERMVTFIQERS